MTDPRRILLIRPSALGDVCRSVPVLVSLRRRWPDSEIDWLVQDAFAPAIASHPDLTGVIPFPRKRLGAWWRSPAAAKEMRVWFGELRRARYDLVLDCQGLFRSGLFMWMTRAKSRVGFANAAELGWLGANRRTRVSRNMHTVDRMMALLEPLGVEPVYDLRLATCDADRAATHPQLRQAASYAVVAPTSRWAGKRWPADRFAEVVRGLLDQGAVEAVAVVGAASERNQCAPVIELAQRDRRVVDLIGKTDVGALLATIKRASIVIANDSAALHIAVGFDRPLVGLFGPTRVDRVGPFGRSGDVLQHVEDGETLNHKEQRGALAIMKRISVEETLEKALKALTSERSLMSASAEPLVDEPSSHPS